MKGKIIIISIFGIISSLLIVANTSIICIEPFFKLSLTDPTAPVNKTYFNHYIAKSTIAFATVAIDRQGYIYLLGEKNKIQKLLVIDQKAKIKRIITIQGQNVFDPMWLGVSPSGKWIWRVEHWNTTHSPKIPIRRITVHDYQGRCIQSWKIKGHDSTSWIFGVPEEDRAYALILCCQPADCFRFTVGKKQPQRFEKPLRMYTCFHQGKFWFIADFKWLLENIPCPQFQQDAKQFKRDGDWFCVGTWSPEEGYHFVTKFKTLVSRIGVIQWIDKDGNFYTFYYDWSPHPIVNLLSKIKPLRNLLTALNVPLKPSKPVKVLVVLSQKGKVLDRIVLSSVIRPRRGENLKYGQLVKVDKKGIYLEVEKVNEPREYRIVRIVKKRHWQVWWEALRSWFSPE